MTGAALTLSGVSCRRGGRLLFEDLDLVLGAGEAALATGANGAGKSSLLRIIAGLLLEASGRQDQRKRHDRLARRSGGARSQADLDERPRFLGADRRPWRG